MKYLKLFIIPIFFWIFSSNLSSVYAASIGVSPGGIYNESLKPGTTFVQEFIISRGNPDKTVSADLTIDATEFNDWINISPSTNIILPAGKQRVPFTLTLEIPENAKYGKYVGFLRVLLENEDQGQVSIQPAVRLDLNFTLTEKDIRLFDTQNAIIQDTDEFSSLVVKLKVRNNGNIAGSPEFIQVDVYSTEDKFVDRFSTNEIPQIPPFTTSSVDVIFDNHGLLAGTYIGEIVVKDLGIELLSDRSIFNVYKGSVIYNLNNLPETGDKNILDKIIELFNNILSENIENLINFSSKNKYLLVGGFLFISATIIFILLLFDRNSKED